VRRDGGQVESTAVVGAKDGHLKLQIPVRPAIPAGARASSASVSVSPLQQQPRSASPGSAPPLQEGGFALAHDDLFRDHFGDAAEHKDHFGGFSEADGATTLLEPHEARPLSMSTHSLSDNISPDEDPIWTKSPPSSGDTQRSEQGEGKGGVAADQLAGAAAPAAPAAPAAAPAAAASDVAAGGAAHGGDGGTAG
jgi:hypothetical protein